MYWTVPKATNYTQNTNQRNKLLSHIFLLVKIQIETNETNADRQYKKAIKNIELLNLC